MDSTINYAKVHSNDPHSVEDIGTKDYSYAKSRLTSDQEDAKHEKTKPPEVRDGGMPSRMFGRSLRASRSTELPAWLWETCYLIAAAVCLIAILWLAIDTDGKRQEEWKLQISLNSLVAILSTIFRSTLEEITGEVISQLKWWWFRQPRPVLHLQHFDEASRGPYGSSLLLYRLQTLSFVQLGCFITLVSYAIGPFIQQAIGNELCSYEVAGVNATLPLAKGDKPGWSSVVRSYGSLFVMNTATKAGIITAIADSQSERLGLLSGCSTGNCSFGQTEYTTMGFCSMCQDTSDSIQEIINGSSSRLTLPNGQYLDNVTHGGMNFSSSPLQFLDFSIEQHLIDVSTASVANISLMTLTSAPCTYIGDATAGNWTCSSEVEAAQDSGWNGIDVVSTACAIFPCMRSYSASVSNGVVEETVANTKPALFGRTASGRFDAIALNDDCKLESGQDLASITNLSTSDDRNTSTGYIDGQEIVIPPSCVNMVTFPYIGGLSELLYTIFTGSCFYPNVDSSMPEHKSRERRQHILCYDTAENVGTTGGSETGGWWLEGFNNKGNATFESISAHMQHVADAMTDRLRLESFNASDSHSYVQGTVMQTTVCTRLRWQWLLLPCCILGLVFIFLATTVFRSSLQREQVPLWKSSMLPLLYAKSSELQPRRSSTIDNFQRAARSTEVGLTQDNASGLWYLSKT